MQTNWTAYYSKPYKTASWSRKITEKIILRLLRKHLRKGDQLAELGGGNSCFFDALYQAFSPSRYDVLDFNALGVKLFNERAGMIPGCQALLWDALRPDFSQFENQPDLVMSFGLIEHFSCEETTAVIKTHFELVKPGGLVLMSFPTPSISYRLIRQLAELTGQWIFTDERPLTMTEVLGTCERYGEKIETFFNHKILLSQGVVLFRKKLLISNGI